MTLHEEIQAASEAKRLLQEPALVKAFADVEAAITQRWATSPLRDTEGQHELRLMLKLLGDVRASLEQAVSNGSFAANELKLKEQSRFQRLKQAIR